MPLDIDKLRRLWDKFVPIAEIARIMHLDEGSATMALKRLGVPKFRCLHGHDLRLPGAKRKTHGCVRCNRKHNLKSHVRERGIARTDAQLRVNQIQRLLLSMIPKVDIMSAHELAEWRQREAKLLHERDRLSRKYAVTIP